MTSNSESLFKESWLMILMYATAIILIFTLTFHILLHSPLTGKAFEATLNFSYVRANLIYYKVPFALVLYAAVIHGMSGLRAVLLEWMHPRRSWIVTFPVAVLLALLLAVGTLTLILV